MLDFQSFVIGLFLGFLGGAVLIGAILSATKRTLGGLTMSLILTDEQKVALSLAAKTAAGNPAKIDGAPVWAISDDSVATLAPAEDGLTCEVTTTGKLGTAQVSAVADADLGEGVREITAVLDIEVKAAEAVTLGIEAGAPEVK